MMPQNGVELRKKLKRQTSGYIPNRNLKNPNGIAMSIHGPFPSPKPEYIPVVRGTLTVQQVNLFGQYVRYT